MAKRNLRLFKKTASEPEVVDEVPETIEPQPDSDGYIPVVYDILDSQPPDTVPPLSTKEQQRREELEGLITRNFKAFYDVGCALREIQQRMLYRSTHDRFSDYLKELWDMARSQAFRLIDAANVVDNLLRFASTESHSDGHTSRVPNWGHECLVPNNENQARTLVKLEPDQQFTVWNEAVKTAPDGKITAAHIKKTARRLHLVKVRDTITKTKQKTNHAPKISEDFRRAFNDFLDAINIERANEYKHTDRDEVIRHVHIILEALEAEL